MPFGLKNAPATFQRMMDVVLQGLESFLVLYIDDVLIFSNCWEDHLEHIRVVIERLQAAGLRAKPSKCLLCSQLISLEDVRWWSFILVLCYNHHMEHSAFRLVEQLDMVGMDNSFPLGDSAR